MARERIPRMESREQLEAKGKILIEALVMCLQRSKVREIVDAQTVRSVLTSALGELWREGEFRLESVWKILCNQPGLSAQEVAPPMFVFKANEEQLGVVVRLPEALASVPRAEQARLRDALGVKPEEFAQYLKELADLQSTEAEGRKLAEVGKQAAESPGESPADARRAAEAAAAKKKKLATIAALLSAIAVLAVSGSLYFGLASSVAPFDTSDVANFVRLELGQRAGNGMTARIADPRWDKLGKDEQKRLAGELAERERAKGITNVTLTDGTGRVRVQITTPPGGRVIILR
jgi:hypothetical protein